jgi:hypothetical protein
MKYGFSEPCPVVTGILHVPVLHPSEKSELVDFHMRTSEIECNGTEIYILTMQGFSEMSITRTADFPYVA